MSRSAIIILIIISILVPEFQWIEARILPTNSKNKSSTNAKKKLQTSQDSIKRQNEPIDYFSVSDPGPRDPFIDVTDPGQNLAALNDDGTDNTAALQAILNYVAVHQTKVYFPPGRYLIVSDVTIKRGTHIYGSREGISLIETDASKARKTRIGNKLEDNYGDIRVEHLFFDGVNIDFGKENHRKNSIFVSHCVFFSTNCPASDANKYWPTVRFLNITNSAGSSRNALGSSVFLRDECGFGRASGFDHSSGIKVRNNIFGLDLGNIGWIDTELRGSSNYLQDLKPKLNYLKTTFHLGNDQGYFEGSIHTGFTNFTLIKNNIFNGSPNSISHHHDHVVYLKGFYDMKFLGNYARGWPRDASGGIKVRNGVKLVIARNYIDSTGILLYTHINAKAGREKYLYKGLKNVLVYGNHIVQRTSGCIRNAFNRTTGISYFEPHKKKEDGKDEDLKYSANVFKIVGSESLPRGACISLTNGNVSEHHVYPDNVFEGTTQLVGLFAYHIPPCYESGNIPLSCVRDYVHVTVPSYNIPPYEEE